MEKSQKKEPKAGNVAAEAAEINVGTPAVPTVSWDDTHMTTSYANVVNAASTREEVTLFFGTNQTWNPIGAKEFNVRLSDRIVLSPYAAKRLWTLLGVILREYERRFGTLQIESARSREAAEDTSASTTS
jgi:uncharacterized protein DUF3467